jgi:DNA modification methylase
METNTIIRNDCLAALKDMPDESVHCCVTSPPYYGLRDYGIKGQVGREATPEQYIAKLAEIFMEVYRVLKTDGTCWLNISDTYCGTGSKGGLTDPKNPEGRNGQKVSIAQNVAGCKHKDLIGIPWMLAFALRDRGWYLRNDIIWQKGNAMPESVKDRLTRSYEHIFLLAKSQKYFYDAAAIAEPIAEDTARRYMGGRGGSHKYSGEVPGQAGVQSFNRPRKAGEIKEEDISLFRNCRDVWLINTVPYRGKHFAAYPPKLAERCILAGCPEGGIVLDPFFGSGTTGLAAVRNGRQYIGIELNGEYCVLAGERIGGFIESRAD